MSDTIVFQVDPNNPDPQILDQATDILANGGIIVAPTETKYGLLTRADSDEALNRLYEVKGRSAQQVSAIFVGSVPFIIHYADLNPIAQRLASLFLPGPLTLILNALSGLNAGITRNGKVGIRVSSSPLIQALMERVTFPVTATSANLSGTHNAELPEVVMADLDGSVELCMFAGKLAGKESTVVDCSGSIVEILREGFFGKVEIEDAIRDIIK